MSVRIIILKGKMEFEYWNIYLYECDEKKVIVVIIVQVLEMLSPLMISEVLRRVWVMNSGRCSWHNSGYFGAYDMKIKIE